MTEEIAARGPSDGPSRGTRGVLLALAGVEVALGLAFAALLFLAWRLGAAFNLAIAALMAVAATAVMVRLFYGFNGWLAPSRLRGGPGTASAWIGTALRVAFVALLVAVAWRGVVPEQFPASEATSIALTIFGSGLVAALALAVPKRAGWVWWMPGLALVPGTALLGWMLLQSHLPDDAPFVVLAPPMEGEMMFMQAGRDPLINYHYAVPSQRHSADIVALDADGRAVGGMGDGFDDPCFARRLLAPASGEVVSVVSDLPDNPLGETDADYPAGNHVVIRMDEPLDPDVPLFVLLAHMKQDSASVAEGERVEAGQPLGICGNSGNTTGAHLHLQVQTRPDLFDPGSETVPMRFRTPDGVRALVREDRLTGLADP